MARPGTDDTVIAVVRATEHDAWRTAVAAEFVRSNPRAALRELELDDALLARTFSDPIDRKFATFLYEPHERELRACEVVSSELDVGESNAIVLPQRTLFLGEADPQTLVDGGWFHSLQAFDPRSPWTLGPDSDILLSEHRAAREACARVAASLIEANWKPSTPPDRFIREALLHARAEGDDLPASVSDIEAWLAEPVARAAPINRYLAAVWRCLPAHASALPRLLTSRPQLTTFLAWANERGVIEHQLDPRYFQQLSATPPLSTIEPAEHSVRVIGHLDAQIGIGEAARRAIRAADHAKILAKAHSYDMLDVNSALDGETAAESQSFAGDVNVVCVNADGIPGLVEDLGSAEFERRHTIGVWYWESTSPPPNLDAALVYVDEIWVASDYVRSVLEPHIHDGTPIHVMPLAVRVPEPGEHPRSHFALPEDAYLYGFMFDFNSTLERKHACGLVEAYRRAYPEPHAGTALVIKTIHAELNVADHERLLIATQDRPDIVVMDAHLSVAERDSLLAHLDCYVSLHRSEGFGLTIAEALLAGVPTIATGYSANVEFAPGDVCYLVDYEMTTVPDGLGPYPAGGEWADPDLDHAARLMRHVREHPEEARAKAAEGARRIAETCSLDAAGSFMRARLEQIWKEHPLPDPEAEAAERAAADPIAQVERYVNDGPSEGWLVGTRGPKRVLRRLLLRITRPYADRQKELEVDVARSLRHLQQQVDALREGEHGV